MGRSIPQSNRKFFLWLGRIGFCSARLRTVQYCHLIDFVLMILLPPWAILAVFQSVSIRPGLFPGLVLNLFCSWKGGRASSPHSFPMFNLQ